MQFHHNERTMNTTADTDTLLAAVNEHHSAGERAVLSRALRRHESRKRERVKPESFTATLRRGFMSFNPWPTNAHDEYMKIIGNRSDAESIASHWRAVGEYLSYGIAKYATEHGLPQNAANKVSVDDATVSREGGSDPLPNPEILARYKTIDPDIPGRIIQIAEEKRAADIARQKNELTAVIKNRANGQRWAPALSALTMLCFALLTVGGYELYGWLLFSGAVVGLGYVFVAGRGRTMCRRTANLNHSPIS